MNEPEAFPLYVINREDRCVRTILYRLSPINVLRRMADAMYDDQTEEDPSGAYVRAGELAPGFYGYRLVCYGPRAAELARTIISNIRRPPQ